MTPTTKGAAVVVTVGAALVGALVLKQPHAATTPIEPMALVSSPSAHAMALLTVPNASAPPVITGPSDECDADDHARAERYSLTAGYEYLKYNCAEIHAWKKQNRIGILDWLAQHGHDSPLATCDVFIDLDREVETGDKVLIYRRDDGKLGDVMRLDDFANLPSYAVQNCATACWFPATVVEESIDGWLVSSYGQRFAVQTDDKSRTLDRESGNLLWFDYKGTHYEHTIDTKAVRQSIAFHVPCWRDRFAITALTGWQNTGCIGGGKVVPCS